MHIITAVEMRNVTGMITIMLLRVNVQRTSRINEQQNLMDLLQLA